MSTTDEILHKALDAFFLKNPVAPGVPLIVGFSGGPDSVALALLLEAYFGSHRIILAYLNHGIRSRQEQLEEEAFVRRFARERGFLLEMGAVPAGLLEAESRRDGESLEDAARRRRYDFFEKIQGKTPGARVFLGHHLDDQMETLVMRFFQGSGAAGLKGISPARDNYRRPLLTVDRRLLAAYLEERGAAFVTDLTNLSGDYLRNRIRHQLLPAVEAIFPGYRRSLEGLGEKMALIQELIEDESLRRLPWREESCGGYSLEAELFWSAPEILRRESLFKLANKTLVERSRIPSRFFRSLKTPPDGRDEAILLRGFGYRLRLHGGRIFWEQDVVFPEKNSYLISIERDLSWAIEEWDFSAALIGRDVPEKRAGTAQGVCIGCNTLFPPFIIRSRREGDEIPLAEGRKSLKKLYNQWGVSKEKRGVIPVLEDREGIFGILGEPWGFPNRFSERPSRDNGASGQGYWLLSWTQGSVFGG